MSKQVVIVGAGINGLVAANYLARAGFDVTILEYKDHAGGACTAAYWEHNGEKHVYPQGASVLGFMEDFVFEETGLSKRVQIARPEHAEVIYHAKNPQVLFIYDDAEQMAEEARKNWGEAGKVKEFYQDLQKVVDFLRKGYREAVVPTLDLARQALGDKLVSLFITGSARALLDHYLTSGALKLFYAVDAIESGPVPLDSPYSAFSIPLMSSGSIFDGEWGYVKDGIWQVPLALDAINVEFGIKRIFGVKVSKVLSAPKSVAVAAAAGEKPLSVYFENVSGGEGLQSVSADYVLLATDPLSAAKISGDQKLLEKISSEKLVGTSGKLVMFFEKPVRWKDSDGSNILTPASCT
jgi:phytoene dehydrogenase-like protein